MNDADVPIIDTVIVQFSSTNITIVVGEGVDLLIILIARTSSDKIIYLSKPGKSQIQTNKNKLFEKLNDFIDNAVITNINCSADFNPHLWNSFSPKNGIDTQV